ncbi:hypothetical protein [Hahella ganghwensis]|uniref:hypothetical protein n=1 Tax=Hahella ganghwensis TaxID=286420 RepID=UPI000370B694|nr:hypothetical protein [Hahella ganghwensis]
MNIRIILYLFFLFFMGCYSEFSIEDYEVGANGEPPKIMEPVHRIEMVADERNFVLAMGLIHAFLVENRFEPYYSDCFDDVLDIRKHRDGFPCIGLMAERGVPAKMYLRVRFDEVLFHQLDGKNRLKYTVEIYSISNSSVKSAVNRIVDVLRSDVYPKLNQLTTSTEALGNATLSDGSSE